MEDTNPEGWEEKIKVLIKEWEENLKDSKQRLSVVKKQEPNALNDLSIPMMTGTVVILRYCIDQLKQLLEEKE